MERQEEVTVFCQKRKLCPKAFDKEDKKLYNFGKYKGVKEDMLFRKARMKESGVGVKVPHAEARKGNPSQSVCRIRRMVSCVK